MSKALGLASSLALLLGAGCETTGLVDAPPQVLIYATDGSTNAGGEAGVWVVVRFTGTPRDFDRVDITLATWPELEEVPSSAEGSQNHDGISLELRVRADEPLEARWYAVLVAIETEDTPVWVHLPHVALADGRVAFRVFGSSAPRIRAIQYDSGAGPVFDARFQFSEAVTFAAGSAPIRVTADGVECRWYPEGESDELTAIHTNFGCTAPAPAVLLVEVLEDMASPGGGLLPAQVLEVLEIDPRDGYRAPIE